jgi:anti-anti-sigma factor
MELRIELIAERVTRAIPAGRWDVSGAASIDLRLSVIVGTGRPVIIDLVEVEFLSSMGIRSILMSAKAARLKGGKLVLLAPAPNVDQVLIAAGIDRLIPIHYDIEQALLAVSS